MTVHHIGYLVKDMEKARDALEALGYSTEQDVVFDEFRGIDISFYIKDGYRVELISPKTEESVVTGLMKRIGNSPYHLCYSSEDFDNDVAELRGKGFMPMDKPAPAPALQGKMVTFLMHRNLGIIEILDKGKE